MTTSEQLNAITKDAIEKSGDKYLAGVTQVLLDHYNAAVASALKLERMVHDIVKGAEV